MTFRTTILAAVAASAVLAAPAFASITITEFDPVAYNDTFGDAPNVGEDFETLGANGGEREVGKAGDPFATAVGDFTTLGGTGTGGTTNPPWNTGTGLALRTGDVFGRENTTPTGGNWFLDSNDTFGLEWVVKLVSGQSFDRILFSLSDAGDQRAFVTVSDGTTEASLQSQSNRNIKLVEIVFGTAVSQATITIENFTNSGQTANRLNDGFSIDGLQVAAVPIPAAGLLLLTAVGGMCVASRRRKAATA